MDRKAGRYPPCEYCTMKTENTKVKDPLVLICFNCKRIKNTSGCWQTVTDYKTKFLGRRISHCLCEDCGKKLYGAEPWYTEPNKVTT